jgi:hypothetical protein
MFVKRFDLSVALNGGIVFTMDGRSVLKVVELHSHTKTVKDVPFDGDDWAYDQGLDVTIKNDHHTSTYRYWHDGKASKFGGCCDADLWTPLQQ